MFRKSFITLLFVAGFVIFTQVPVHAQTVPTSGKVELRKADNTVEPIAGALIEVYRTDIKSKAPSAKTNRRGEFYFAGLMLGGTYTLAVSAPNAAPNFATNIKPGQENLIITLTPGDGSKLSEDEVRKGTSESEVAPAGDTAAELTAAQKKELADHEAQIQAVTAKNQEIEQKNQILDRVAKEGAAAFKAKNYDLAVALYDEGIAADPEFIGSAPIFYNNRGASLLARGIDRYNKAVKATVTSEKVEGLATVRKDLADAAESYRKAWTVLSSAQPTAGGDGKSYEGIKLSTLRGSNEVFEKAVRTAQVDPAVIESAKVLVSEFIRVEPDETKKVAASTTFADLYRVALDSENAIAEYKKILETQPNNPDALAGAGLSLVNHGYMNDDKAVLQEGANMLQKFISVAPDSHKYKADAVALIESLKTENIAPQKTTPARRRN